MQSVDLAPDLYPRISFPASRERTCGKRGYRKVEAQTALNARPRSHHNRPDELRIYKCPICRGGQWHITSKEHYDSE